MPTVAFRTLGCKQNQFDTQALRRHLQDRGLRLVSRLEEADWIILNTCAVTERALAKARGDVHRLRRLNPGAKIFALGCGARYAPQAFAAEGCVIAADPALSGWGLFDPGLDLAPPHGFIPAGKTRGLLRIQTGCDQTCAYCIVPSLRGSSRSVPLDDCRQAMSEVIGLGAPEVVLTGTNIALWGRDLPGWPVLKDLLTTLAAQAGEVRLRLSSLEPHLVSPELLAWCLDQPNLCRHFHFSFQSGSPRVLDLMQRHAPAEGLVDYVRGLARSDPGVCLGADLIAGYPGETEDDFQESLDWVRSIPLNYLHVFPFSERIGTGAADHTDSIPLNERLRRAALLRRLSADLKAHFIQSNRSSVQDVIMMKTPGQNQGLTSNYLRITFGAAFKAAGSRFPVSLADESVASIQMQK